MLLSARMAELDLNLLTALEVFLSEGTVGGGRGAQIGSQRASP
jgi:hypothetical protein